MIARSSILMMVMVMRVAGILVRVVMVRVVHGGDVGLVGCDVGGGGGGILRWLVSGALILGRMSSPFPDDEVWDLLVQKCTCVATLTQVPSISVPSPLRCRASLHRLGFPLNAQYTSR